MPTRDDLQDDLRYMVRDALHGQKLADFELECVETWAEDSDEPLLLNLHVYGKGWTAFAQLDVTFGELEIAGPPGAGREE